MEKNWRDIMNTPRSKRRYDKQDIEDNKLWAALSYVAFLFIIPLFINGGKSAYAKYHANQGMLLFITELVCILANYAICWIPVLGWIIRIVLILAILFLVVQGIVNAVSGCARQLPLIGDLLHIIDR